MANYCFNRLTVRGDQKELNRFRTTIWKSEDEPINFASTVPIPPELENTQCPNNDPLIIRQVRKIKYGYDNWYDWQLANWGCKWGPYDHSMSDPEEKIYKNGKGKLVYTFDTPWSPPTEWIMNTSKLFPSLKFQNYCNEPGCCFKGTQFIINGMITKDTIK